MLSLPGFWLLVEKHNPAARRFFFIGIGMVVFLGSYYGVLFGAPHFMARYLSILSPFLF